MNLTPTSNPIGTVPRHFVVPRMLRRPVDPPTFGLYTPGALYPGVYEESPVRPVAGADQATLTDYVGEPQSPGE